MQISLSTVGVDSELTELVLRNLVTKQMIRFPINLKLTTQIEQTKASHVAVVSTQPDLHLDLPKISSDISIFFLLN